MKVIGLTGGIGAGKSVCADLLRQQKIPVIDTDDLAREVVQPGEPALARIIEVFGPGFLTPEGELDRRRMAERVFQSETDRLQLEAIVHPPIRERWKTQIALWRAEHRPLAFVVIPLLYETGAETDFDAIVCLACSAQTQRARLVARGWSPAQIDYRLAAQWPIEKKIHAAHFVIWSEFTIDLHGRQLTRILRHLSHQSPTLRSSQL